MQQHYVYTGTDIAQAFTQVAALLPEGSRVHAQYGEVQDELGSTGTCTLVLITGDEAVFAAAAAARDDFTVVPGQSESDRQDDDHPDADVHFLVRDRLRRLGQRQPPTLVLLSGITPPAPPTQTSSGVGLSAERRYDLPPGHHLVGTVPSKLWIEVEEISVHVSQGLSGVGPDSRRFSIHGWGARPPRGHAPSAYITGTCTDLARHRLPEWALTLLADVSAEVDRLVASATSNPTVPPENPAPDLGAPELADLANEYTLRPTGEAPRDTWVRVTQTDSRSGWTVTRGTEIWDGEQWASIFNLPERHRLVLPLGTAIAAARREVQSPESPEKR